MSAATPTDRLVRIETRLEGIEDAINALREDVRPGVLHREAELQRVADIRARLERVEVRTASQERRLDRVLAWAAGVGAGVSAAVSGAMAWAFRVFGHGATQP